MNKNKAYTFAEMFLALIVIMIISSLAMSAFKENISTKKLRFFAYTTVINLMKASSAAAEKAGNTELHKIANIDSKYDWFCTQVASLFSLKGSYDCTTSSAGDTKVNLTAVNGVTIQGLSTPWVKLNDSYYFKNIVMDVDGPNKGVNKLYADRIPLRIFSGGKLSGTVTNTNCGAVNNKVYGNSTGLDNPYCDNNGSAVTSEYLLDNKIITYDIIQADPDDQEKGVYVATNLSPMEADCRAYSTTGLYSKETCLSKGFPMLHQCLEQSICSTCDTYGGICKAQDETTTITTATCNTTVVNKKPCLTMIHKPSTGAGIILESLLGDIIN